MDSKLGKQAERDLVAATQRLSPEQRLDAMLAHCRLMAKLQGAVRPGDRVARPARS